MISLEELRAERFELVAKWLSNPEINQWLTAEWRGREVTSTVIAVAVRNRRNRMFVVLEQGQPCGLVALADLDTSDKTAMVWYFLGERSLGGKGITSDAVRQLARIAFRELGLESLYAWAMQDNTGSQKVLQKAGFVRAGRIRRATHSPAGQVDRIYFDLVSSEFTLTGLD